MVLFYMIKVLLLLSLISISAQAQASEKAQALEASLTELIESKRDERRQTLEQKAIMQQKLKEILFEPVRIEQQNEAKDHEKIHAD